jgi:hypothetical protein
VDVLTSRRILVQAETDYAVSRYDYIVSVIQLRLAAGNLSRSDVTEVNKWLAVSAPTVPAHPIEPPAQPQVMEQPQSPQQQNQPQQAPQPPTPTPPQR